MSNHLPPSHPLSGCDLRETFADDPGPAPARCLECHDAEPHPDCEPYCGPCDNDLRAAEHADYLYHFHKENP